MSTKLATVLLFITMVLIAPAYGHTIIGTNVGDQAPEFTLKDLNGNSVNLSDLQGDIVWLIFGRTTCPYCRMRVPILNGLADDGYKVFFVYIRQSPDTVRKFIKGKNIRFGTLLDTNAAVARRYHIRGVPACYLVDEKGVIVYSANQDGQAIWSQLASQYPEQQVIQAATFDDSVNVNVIKQKIKQPASSKTAKIFLNKKTQKAGLLSGIRDLADSLLAISLNITGGLVGVRATVEICNYEDDDGDGLCFGGSNPGTTCTQTSDCHDGGSCIMVDEDFTYNGIATGLSCDGVGECGIGTVYCVDTSTSDCSTNPGRPEYDGSPETCDNLDNDCDGETDEDFNDVDLDGFNDCLDNCPNDYNPDQNDIDVDGIGDICDNCPDINNPSQIDSDMDGWGNVCDDDCADFDGYNPVDFNDFSSFAMAWQHTGPELPTDLNYDEVVDNNDLAIFALYWLSDCYEE